MKNPVDVALEKCEKELAEANRIIAWLRSGGWPTTMWEENGVGVIPIEKVSQHLASSPPASWKAE